MNPSLGATDAIHGVGPPLRSAPGALSRHATADVRETEKTAQLSCTVRFSMRFSKVP